MAVKKSPAKNKGGAAKRPPRLIDMPGFEKLYGYFEEGQEYINLLFNAFSIKRTDGQVMPYRQEVFIKRQIIFLNTVGYSRVGDMWLCATGQDIDEYGFPRSIILRTANGRTFGTFTPSWGNDLNGKYIIRGVPYPMSLAALTLRTVDELAATDIAIRQNRAACQAPWYVIVKDEETRLSIENAIEQKMDGRPVIVVDAALEDAFKGIDMNTPYIVDKLLEYRDAVRDRLLNKLGIMSANINKRERVQVGELNATVGQCLDYIYMLIDNLNRQFKAYNLPYYAENNGTTEELYSDSLED